MKMQRKIPGPVSMILAALMLVGQPMTAGQIVSSVTHPDHPRLPPDARPDQCFAYEFTPAIIETITEKTPLTPPRLAVDLETGKTEVIRPATYKTVKVQRVVRERQEQWFPTPCPQVYTERFVQSLQRAMKARGFYSGPVTGLLDEQTQLAVKLYQRQDGVDSAMLSLKTVEDFGLISHRDFSDFTDN